MRRTQISTPYQSGKRLSIQLHGHSAVQERSVGQPHFATQQPTPHYDHEQGYPQSS